MAACVALHLVTCESLVDRGVGSQLPMAVATDASWPVFLAEVDEVSDTQKNEEIEAKFRDAGWPRPRSIVGADAVELVESLGQLSAPDRAFVRRILRSAEKEATPAPAEQPTPATQVVPASQPHSQPELEQTLRALLGSEGSALRVAEALAKGDTKVDVVAVMEKGKMETISDSYCPGVEVYTAVHVDTKAAKKDGRKPFTYVDLTHGSVLPEYLPPEAVGGKTLLPGHDEVLSGYTGSIAQLGNAIKSLTTAPRVFRNMTQWTSAFMRYAVVAVAFEQVDWQFIVVHVQLVLRIAQEESTMVALIYDEMQRKSWARRASKGEVSLDILQEAMVKNQQVVETAKSKVKLVARASGLQAAHGPDSSYNSPAEHLGDAEAAISKQVAMAEAVQKRAEQATTRMQNQRFNFPHQGGWGSGQQNQKQRGGQQNNNGKNKNNGGNSGKGRNQYHRSQPAGAHPWPKKHKGAGKRY